VSWRGVRGGRVPPRESGTPRAATITRAGAFVIVLGLGACGSHPLAVADAVPPPIDTPTGQAGDTGAAGAGALLGSAGDTLPVDAAAGARGASDGAFDASATDTSDADASDADASDADTSDADAAETASPDATPPSCAAMGVGVSTCGPMGDSCCASLLVPGGSYVRSYDGVSCPGGDPPMLQPEAGCYTHATDPAAVSAFRLDKYLATVGRFRRFIDAVVAGWRPAAGSGRHTHLNGGLGLADVAAPGKFETGWDATWNADLFADAATWQNQLVLGDGATSPEDLAVGNLEWTQAYAFCIWDGGFLPSEAEWNYAAAGGDQQRVYPWSSPPTSTLIDCAHASVDLPGCVLDSPLRVGTFSPASDSRWGHVQLVGNMEQWNLDWLATYVSPCVDCAYLQVPPADQVITIEPVRVQRGNFGDDPSTLVTSMRAGDFITGAWGSDYGVRCARAPSAETP
jgi:formylglycine-generating enzyme